jgi:hypothetical protein
LFEKVIFMFLEAVVLKKYINIDIILPDMYSKICNKREERSECWKKKRRTTSAICS